MVKAPTKKAEERGVLDRIYEALRDDNKPATQSQIAGMLKIKQPSVSEWKKTLPSLRHALALARLLNVCVEWLYTERGPKRPGAPLEWSAQALWDLWPRLPDAIKHQLVGHAQMSLNEGSPKKGDSVPASARSRRSSSSNS